MTRTFTDCSTVRILDITAFGPYIGSPWTAFSATSSAVRIEASTVPDSTHVGAQEPPASTGGMGERERICPESFLLMIEPGANVVVSAIQLGTMKATFPIGRQRSELDLAQAAKTELLLMVP